MKDDYKSQYILPADTDYIVESIDIANGAQIIAHQPDCPRNATITVTDGNTSIDAGTITITGTDPTGAVVSESLDLTSALTKTGTQMFKTITSVVVASLHGAAAGDTLIVGIGGTIQVKTGQGKLIAVIVGTTANATVGIVDNITGSTVNLLGLKASIAEGIYKFGCVFAVGLRVILGGASKLTIIYC